MTAKIASPSIGKLENVKDLAVLLTDGLESIANGDLLRTDVVRIDNDADDTKVEVRPRSSARQRDRAGRNATATVPGICPVGQICDAVAEGQELTASEQFAVGDTSHGEGKASAGDALFLPSSDDAHGVFERRGEVVGELEAYPVLGVTIGFEQNRGVLSREVVKTHDAIAHLWHSVRRNIHWLLRIAA